MSNSYLPRRHNVSSERDGEPGDLPQRAPVEAYFPGPGYYPPQPPVSGQDQIARMLDLISRRKWTILIGFLVVLGLTTAYTMMLTPEYEASSYVMVDLGEVVLDIGRNSSSADTPEDAGFELFARSDRSLAGEIRLLEISDQLVMRVNTRVEEQQEAATDQPYAIPRGRVHFIPERGSDNILRFVGRSSNPDQASTLANLYAEEYVELTQEASKSHALSVRETLEQKEKEQLAELNLIEDQLNRFKQSGVVDLDQASSRLVQQIASLDVEREETRIELQVERAALSSLEQEIEEINPQLAMRIASGVERRLETLQEQLATDEDARAKILLENPDLRGRETDALKSIDDRITRLRTEIDSLSLQFVEEVSAAGGLSGSGDGLAYVASLRQQIAEKRVTVSRLEAKIGVLERRINSDQATLRGLPRQSMELAQLERARLRVDMKYQSTAEQLQIAYVAEESVPGYAQIIRRATPPRSSLYPDVPRSIILGIFFGLLLGFAVAIVRDKLDNRIYQPEQLREIGFKEIGVIPNMQPLIKKNFGGEAFQEHNGQHVSTSLIPLLNPITSTAEAYRYIRTHIHLGHPGEIFQTLMITSPGVSEGKSTTASNLAIVMAQAGQKTLLIDADLRRPKIHKKFGLPLSSGLIEILTDSSFSNPESWATAIDNLSVLTAGSPIFDQDENQGINGETIALDNKRAIILNPSELLGSKQMSEFIASMRTTFDTIIIDTPPILVATDAPQLSAQCDASIVVVRSGSTKGGEIVRAVETLNSVGAMVLGVLLNGFDINMSFGHKYKYQDYTSYGSYSQYGGYYGVNSGD